MSVNSSLLTATCRDLLITLTGSSKKACTGRVENSAAVYPATSNTGGVAKQKQIKDALLAMSAQTESQMSVRAMSEL